VDNPDNGNVDRRAPKHETINGGITFAAIAYTGLSVIGTFVGILLWQVWINTGRLDRMEATTIANDRDRMRLEVESHRDGDRFEKRIDQLMTRIDALSVACEQLMKRHQ
jgi:hypothetical protein